MFEKPFELLNRAVDRIESQLEAADREQAHLLGEELVALRNVCDKFVEKWLSFEERVAELSEEYSLDLDGTLPTPELQQMQEKWAQLQQPPMIKDAEHVQKNTPAELPKQADAVDQAKQAAKKETGTFHWQVGDGQALRPKEEGMVRSFRRGVGYFDLLMFPEALEEFKQVLEVDNQFVIARLYLAFGYVSLGQHEEAQKHLTAVQDARDAQDDEFLQATVHATFGHIHAAEEQYERALIEFEAAANLMPQFRDIHFNIGSCHFNLGQPRDALRHYQRALVMEPEDWESHRLCGLIWEEMGHMDRAYRHLARAYDLNGAQQHVLLDFARLSELQGEFAQSRALYHKALRYHPTLSGAYGGLGWLKLRDGEVAEATALFKKQLTIAPHDRQGLFNFGWACFKAQDYRKAEASFSQLLTRNARDAHALAGLARTWSATGKKGEAKELLLKLVATENAADKKLGLYNLGRLALDEEAYVQALRYFNAALVYDRDCVESLFYKGVAHYALGETERADQCFSRCKTYVQEGSVV